MRRCTNCGIIVTDDSLTACQNCGQQLPEPVSQPQPTYQAQPAQPAYQAQPAQPAYQAQPAQPAYQAQPAQPAYQAQPAQPAYQAQPTQPVQPTYPGYAPQGSPFASQPELPMKWYKALIYAILFISMLLNAFSAYRLYTGDIYVDSAIQSGETISSEEKEQFIDYIYEFYGSGLKTCDMFYVVCLVGSIVLAILARQALVNYKKNAPKLIVGLYAYNLLTGILYVIWQYSVISAKVPDASLDSGVISSLALSLAMVIANYKYFKNREHLFVN